MSTFPDNVNRLTIGNLTVGNLIPQSSNSVSKQGAVSGSDFTNATAGFLNVTGCQVVTGGAAMIVVAGQIVTAASVTQAILKVQTPGAGAISGVWFFAVDTATAGDITSFAIGTTATSPNIATAGTYDFTFIGYVTTAGTYNLQAESDGTRTLTVKIGTQLISSI